MSRYRYNADVPACGLAGILGTRTYGRQPVPIIGIKITFGITQNNELVNLTRAMVALKDIEWFKNSVRDIRAFKVEDWSDFTGFMKDY